MDPLDNVGALAQRPKYGLGVLRQAPLRGTERLGETKPLELTHASDHGRTDVTVHRAIDTWSQVDNPIVLRGLAGQSAIETGPTVRLDLSVEAPTDLLLAPRPKLKGDQMRGTSAQALTDVVARDHQVAPIVAFASHDDVDVGIVGVPVVDPNPIELRAEIPLGLRHQVPGKCLQVGELTPHPRGTR